MALSVFGTAFRTQTATGTTTNSFATALDIDMRGVESGTCTIENTDGANSLNYKVLVEYADYNEGEQNQLVASTAITTGNKDYFQLEKGYARCLVQVQSAVADSHATYSIEALINRL